MKTRQSGKDETEASDEKNTQLEPQPEAEPQVPLLMKKYRKACGFFA